MGVSPFRPTSGQSYEDDITQSQGLTKATPIHPNLKKTKKTKKPKKKTSPIPSVLSLSCDWSCVQEAESCSSWKMTKKKKKQQSTLQ